MNLFLSTRSTANSQENHLTEFLAAALDSDRAFRDAYASVVLRNHADRRGWANVEIVGVTTQKSYPDTGCCPDLVLTLKAGQIVACEHKIEAPETLGGADPGGDPMRQLARYLQLPVDGVAYFRASWAPPAPAILEHPKYVRPQHREHFLWSDLHAALRIGTTDVAHWLTEGFEAIGYTLPHPTVGDLSDPDPEIRAANRQNFEKLWQRTRSTLGEQGWKVDTGSICELYLRAHRSSSAESIYISPLFRGLFVRITPRQESSIGEIQRRVGGVAKATGLPVEVASTSVIRAKGRQAVVDVTVSLTKLLEGSSTCDEIEQRLWSYVMPLVQAVDASDANQTAESSSVPGS